MENDSLKCLLFNNYGACILKVYEEIGMPDVTLSQVVCDYKSGYLTVNKDFGTGKDFIWYYDGQREAKVCIEEV